MSNENDKQLAAEGRVANNEAARRLSADEREAINDYLRSKGIGDKLSLETRVLIDGYLRRRVLAAIGVLAAVGSVGGYAIAQVLIERAVTSRVDSYFSQAALVSAQGAAMETQLAGITKGADVIARHQLADSRMKEIESDVAALEKARQIVKALPLESAANLAATISSLGQGDAASIVKRIDELERKIPTRIEITRGAQLNWANRNVHQTFCSDQGQVMIAGAIGTTNGDFSPYCGELRLSR